jgi:prolipoprotein diacylglyceryltransferase
MGSVGGVGMTYGFVFVLLILTGFTFWIWMIVDCVTHEPSTGNDKVVWIVILVFTYVVGALIYYFVRRRPRRFAQ